MFKMLIQNKEKVIPRQKNSIGCVEVGLRVMKKKKKEKVLEVQISIQGLIICNTYKTLFFKLILVLYNVLNLYTKF